LLRIEQEADSRDASHENNLTISNYRTSEREAALLLEDDICFAMAAVLCAGLPPQVIDILETVLANIRASENIQVNA
jgi:hypothetical protein